MSRGSKAFALVTSLVVSTVGAIATIAFFSSHSFAWRTQVLVERLTGDFAEIPLTQFVAWLQPGSGVYLEDLVVSRNVAASVKNRLSDPGVTSAGKALFQDKCSHCHGADAKGGNAPNLLQAVGHLTDWGFLSTVKWGRSGTAMQAQPLTDEQIWQVHAHLRVEKRLALDDPATPGAATRSPVNVTAEAIESADRRPEEWLTYAGNQSGHRHSALTQVNRDTVQNMRVSWVAQLMPSKKPLAATPIVAGGLMFVSEAPDGVVALDIRSGRVVWRFNRPIESAKLSLCCGAFNRGVAVLGSRVFVATLDSYLVALDAATGKKVWETKVAEAQEGYSMTGAPLAVGDSLVVGVAGAEYGIRGFIAAYSADTGRLNWRFECIPGRGSPGVETWAGDSWKTGGVSTWTTGAYDKALDVVYWSTGNPWPPLNTQSRDGDNLYSDSLVALDRKTGKLVWHYQFTPADNHDWDAAQQPVLADITWKGKKVPVVLQANRNAFFYAIDRRSGEFLFAKPFVKQTWAAGFDAKGRPTRRPEADPSKEGTLVWPWMHGGTNWWAPSFDAKRGVQFVPTVDAATLYFKGDAAYKKGELVLGGTTRLALNQPAVMSIKAIDAETGSVRWQTRLDEGDFHQFARIAGLLSTDGGLVFGGFEGRLVALDADSGKTLWQFRHGGLVNAAPVTYTIDGVQQVAYVAGNSVFAFSLPGAK